MDDAEAALVHRWQTIHHTDDITQKQKWYGDAYRYLTTPTTRTHWWCQHRELLQALAPVLRYSSQPIVQAIWGTISQQLEACPQCVICYHSTKAILVQEYGAESVAALLQQLHAKDLQRLLPRLEPLPPAPSAVPAPATPQVCNALLEALCSWRLLADARLAAAVATTILRAEGTLGQVAAEAGCRLPGLYLLLSHPDRSVRRLASAAAQAAQQGPLGPLAAWGEVEGCGLEELLAHWTQLLEFGLWDPAAQQQWSEAQGGGPRPVLVLPQDAVWAALKATLHHMLDAPLVELARRQPALVAITCSHCDADTPPVVRAHAVACLRRLLQALGPELWLHSEAPPRQLVASLLQQLRACPEERLLKLLADVAEVLLPALLAPGSDADAPPEGDPPAGAGGQGPEEQLEAAAESLVATLLVTLPRRAGCTPLVRSVAQRAAFRGLLQRLLRGAPPAWGVRHWGAVAQALLGSVPVAGDQMGAQAAAAAADLVGAVLLVDSCVLGTILDPAGADLPLWQDPDPQLLATCQAALDARYSHQLCPSLVACLAPGCRLPAARDAVLAAAAHLAALQPDGEDPVGGDYPGGPQPNWVDTSAWHRPRRLLHDLRHAAGVLLDKLRSTYSAPAAHPLLQPHQPHQPQPGPVSGTLAVALLRLAAGSSEALRDRATAALLAVTGQRDRVGALAALLQAQAGFAAAAHQLAQRSVDEMMLLLPGQVLASGACAAALQLVVHLLVAAEDLPEAVRGAASWVGPLWQLLLALLDSAPS